MHSFKKAAAAIAIAGMMMPAAAFAETSTSSLQTLLQQIQTLQAQIKAAQSQQQTAIGQLLTTLKQGDKGENVKMLQQLLASDPTLYPEGTVSGFFGPRTAAAIKRFQKRHGIEQAGNFGPKTLKKFNEIFSHLNNASSTKSNDDNDDHDNQGKNDDKNKPCEGNNGLHLGWFIGNGNKDKEHDCKGNGQGTTTPPVVTDTTAPVLSAPTVGSVATTTATVSWTTNEAATGKVYFGIVNPLVLGSASTQATTTLSTGHSFSLTGLSASTTYFYVVESKDAANNTGTSIQGTFTTTN